MRLAGVEANLAGFLCSPTFIFTGEVRVPPKGSYNEEPQEKLEIGGDLDIVTFDVWQQCNLFYGLRRIQFQNKKGGIAVIGREPNKLPHNPN